MRYRRFLTIALLIILIDQISKYYLTTTVNYGAAFGILQNQRLFLSAVAIIALIVIGYYLPKVHGNLIEISLAILTGGIIGNLIDRLYFGYVRDFISFWIWPNFNLADTANCIGVFLIILWLWKYSED